MAAAPPPRHPHRWLHRPLLPHPKPPAGANPAVMAATAKAVAAAVAAMATVTAPRGMPNVKVAVKAAHLQKDAAAVASVRPKVAHPAMVIAAPRAAKPVNHASRVSPVKAEMAAKVAVAAGMPSPATTRLHR